MSRRRAGSIAGWQRVRLQAFGSNHSVVLLLLLLKRLEPVFDRQDRLI